MAHRADRSAPGMKSIIPMERAVRDSSEARDPIPDPWRIEPCHAEAIMSDCDAVGGEIPIAVENTT